jgi:hypothetical protein
MDLSWGSAETKLIAAGTAEGGAPTENADLALTSTPLTVAFTETSVAPISPPASRPTWAMPCSSVNAVPLDGDKIAKPEDSENVTRAPFTAVPLESLIKALAIKGLPGEREFVLVPIVSVSVSDTVG